MSVTQAGIQDVAYTLKRGALNLRMAVLITRGSLLITSGPTAIQIHEGVGPGIPASKGLHHNSGIVASHVL